MLFLKLLSSSAIVSTTTATLLLLIVGIAATAHVLVAVVVVATAVVVARVAIATVVASIEASPLTHGRRLSTRRPVAIFLSAVAIFPHHAIAAVSAFAGLEWIVGL